MDPFTQVKSAEHTAKFNAKSISNRGTFCNFSLAPKKKINKTSMRHLKIHKFAFINVIVLAKEWKMYLKIQQKLHCLGCISTQSWEDTKGLHCKYPGELHTIPYNFVIRNCMELSRRLFLISLGAADFVTYDQREVFFPTPFCQENVIIWKQNRHDRVQSRHD